MRKFKRILMILLILVIGYIGYVSIDICAYSKVNETLQADAAIILGAAIWGDEPSPVFAERINHGIWLYENGYVRKLIFTGGKGEDEKYSESSIAKKYAIEHSVPSEDILIEEQSTITQENLLYAAQIVKENNLSTVLIVSDPLHMKRSMLMAKDYGLNSYSSPTLTTRYQTIKSKSLFLAREVYFYIGYKICRLF